VAAGVAGGASWFASSKTAADLDGVVQQMALVRDALAELQPSVAALANEVAHLRASVAELEQRAPPVPLADGTGRPDYALASMGARVVGSSPTSLPLAMALLQRAARLLPSLLSPADQFLLSPGVVAGRCLPLRGSEGYVDIKLAHPIFLQAVTYEHVQRSLAHSTASPPPAALSVQATLGAAPLRRGDAPLLGTFMYSGDSLQTFAVASEAPVDHVRVGVSGGSGGAGGYVCVYRIRVHGRAA
jgi:SUN domain-containing protein 1/2